MDPSTGPVLRSAEIFSSAVNNELRKADQPPVPSAVREMLARVERALSLAPEAVRGDPGALRSLIQQETGVSPELREGAGTFFVLHRFSPIREDGPAGRIVLAIAGAGDTLPSHRHRAPKKSEIAGEIMLTLLGAVQFSRAESNPPSIQTAGDTPEISHKETEHYFVSQAGLWIGLYFQAAPSDWIATEETLNSPLQIPDVHHVVALASMIVTNPLEGETPQNFLELAAKLEEIRLPLLSIGIHHRIPPAEALFISALIELRTELGELGHAQKAAEQQVEQIKAASRRLPDMLRQSMSEGTEFGGEAAPPEALEQLGKLFGANGLMVQRALAESRASLAIIRTRRTAALEKFLVAAAQVQPIKEFMPAEEF